MTGFWIPHCWICFLLEAWSSQKMNILKKIWTYIKLYLMWLQVFNKDVKMKSFTVWGSWLVFDYPNLIVTLQFITKMYVPIFTNIKKMTMLIRNWLKWNINLGYFNAAFYDHKCGILKNILGCKICYSCPLLSRTF